MKKSGSKKRKRLIILFCLISLPVLVMILAVQPFFIRSVILPRVEKATNSQISVEGLKLAPLSHLSVTGLQFQTNDPQLKVQAEKAVIRYDLIAIFKGTVVVNELTLITPIIHYDATAAGAEKEGASQTDATASQTPQLQIRNVNVVNGSIHLTVPKGTLQIGDLNFRLPELMNGQPVRPTLHAKFSGSTHENPDILFMEGFLDMNMEVAISDRFTPTGLKGTLEAVIGENQAGLPEMKMKLDTDLGLDMDKGILRLQKFSASAIRGITPLLRLQLSNPTEVQWLQQPPVFTDCQISLELPQVEIPSLPFAQLLPVKEGLVFINSQLTVSNSGKEIHSDLDFGLKRLVLPGAEDGEVFSVGDLKGTGSLAWTEGKDFEAVFQLDMENVKMPDGKTLPSPLFVKLDTVANPSHAKLNQLEFGWAETSGFSNRIQVSGDVDWGNLNALAGQLKIRGHQLDLDPWDNFLTPAANTDAAANETVNADTTKQPIDFTFPDWPVESLGVDLAVTKIHYRDVDIEQLQLKAVAESRQLSMTPLSFMLNGSTFTSTAQADWSHPVIRIGLTAALSPLDLQPIADSFLPEKQGAVTGILQGQTEFNLQGEDVQALWDSFQGEVNFAYTNGKIRLLNADPEQNTALLHTRKLVQEVVTGMAEALQLSPEQLMEPEIESVTFTTTLENKQMLIRNVEILNPEFRMEAEGEILLKPDVGQSQIVRLPLVLGLETNLAKRVKIYRQERVKDAYVVLPAFVEVKGSLGKPEIKVKKGVLAGLIISGVTERNDIGNENVQTGLNILGTLLTGETAPQKTNPTPAPSSPGATPSPTPEPTKSDKILEGLKLFQELRATPVPKPETH